MLQSIKRRCLEKLTLATPLLPKIWSKTLKKASSKTTKSIFSRSTLRVSSPSIYQKTSTRRLLWFSRTLTTSNAPLQRSAGIPSLLLRCALVPPTLSSGSSKCHPTCQSSHTFGISTTPTNLKRLWNPQVLFALWYTIIKTLISSWEAPIMVLFHSLIWGEAILQVSSNPRTRLF